LHKVSAYKKKLDDETMTLITSARNEEDAKKEKGNNFEAVVIL
jgi:hypothetical protein